MYNVKTPCSDLCLLYSVSIFVLDVLFYFEKKILVCVFYKVVNNSVDVIRQLYNIPTIMLSIINYMVIFIQPEVAEPGGQLTPPNF